MKLAALTMLTVVTMFLALPAVALAGLETCPAGNRACQRAKLLKMCYPLNANLTRWICPESP
jgi:hypothetical protein